MYLTSSVQNLFFLIKPKEIEHSFFECSSKTHSHVYKGDPEAMLSSILI